MIIAAFDLKPTTLLKILGSAILFLATIHLLIGFINLSNQDFLINLIDQNFRVNPDYYFFLMPFLFMIGLSYLILGIRLPKLKSGILVSHIVISILLIIWTICWMLVKDNGQETRGPGDKETRGFSPKAIKYCSKGAIMFKSISP
jgi:hypothetical protein